MRTFGLGVTIAGILVLSGCASGPFSSGHLAADITTVQAWAKDKCQYEPTLQTVADIFKANPIVASLEGLAIGICDAVTKASAIRGAYPTYAGVRLRGRFVRP